jgi:hypothetical protein
VSAAVEFESKEAASHQVDSLQEGWCRFRETRMRIGILESLADQRPLTPDIPYEV